MALINPQECYGFRSCDRIHQRIRDELVRRGDTSMVDFLAEHPGTVRYQTEGERHFVSLGIDVVRAASDLRMSEIQAEYRVALNDPGYFADEEDIMLVSELEILSDRDYQLFQAQLMQPQELSIALTEAAARYAANRK